MKPRILYCLTLVIMSAALTAQAGPLVQFRTVLGDIEVELFEDKPVTTRNFIRYVQSGWYANMFLHRWIPKFVVQGGGYAIMNRGATNAFVYDIPSFGEITNEFGVGRRSSNVFGTIAMAKLPDNPNSASSEWFFNLADNAANLDNQNGGFTVFGAVVRGTNVLNRFNLTAASNNLYVANFGAPFTDTPVYSTNGINWDYLFTDVTLLSVGIENQGTNQRAISWNSMKGLTNVVEYTTNLPPSWQLLAATNGTGNRLTVVDGNAKAAARFYRVRVMY